MNTPRLSPRCLIGLLIFSCGQMLLEITLTRFFSALFYPPYVFAVLSLAVLGIGLGAALASARKALRRADLIPLYMVLAGVSALIIVAFAVFGGAAAVPAAIFVLVALPYFFAGLVLATLFSLAPSQSTQLYMADLLGAGLGVILAIPTMNAVGPINTVLLTILLFGLAALIIRIEQRWYWQVGVIAAALILLASNIAMPWLNVDPASLPTSKPIKDDLAAKGHVVKTVWDSFARTDLVAPVAGEPLRVYIDGAAGSIMPSTTHTDPLVRDVGFFPFATQQPRRVLVIGPGGGLDVWFALQSKASDITAVEVNPASVALVKDYGDHNGHLYDQPSVRVVVDEGRSFLRRDNSLYDLIFLSQVVTLSADRSGYALTENTIYTVEAFRDYLQHLTPDGQIALKLYDETTLTRALSTALEVLRRNGMSESVALTHIAVLLDPRAQPPIPLLMVSKKALTRDDALVYGSIAHDVGLVPLYLPEVIVQPPLDSVVQGTRTFADIVNSSTVDISPPTDDRPFFFQFERGIPNNLRPLLVAVLGFSVLAAGFAIYSVRRLRVRTPRWSPLYFASLGIGYIVIEIAVIQQTRLFLGHPALAITTVLATLLIGSGMGSWLAGLPRLQRIISTPMLPAIAVVAVAMLWTLSWPIYSQSFMASPVPLRILAAVAFTLPLGILMGMPFPLAIRSVAVASETLVSLGWAVNGVATVLGSVGAVTLAILFGFQSVLIAGICAYAVAGISAYLGVLRTS